MIPTFEDSVIWNKTYLYIPDATSLYSSATEFDLYISVVNENNQNDIRILFDNFKSDLQTMKKKYFWISISYLIFSLQFLAGFYLTVLEKFILKNINLKLTLN